MVVFKLVYGPGCPTKITGHYWLVGNSSKCDIQSLAKYPTINITGIAGNNIDKLIDYQILANTLILKLK